MFESIDAFRTLNYQDIITKEITEYKVSYWVIVPTGLVFFSACICGIWILLSGVSQIIDKL